LQRLGATAQDRNIANVAARIGILEAIVVVDEIG
jgi:hypothetical protein